VNIAVDANPPSSTANSMQDPGSDMLLGRKAREDELSYARIVHAVLLAALPCVASAQNPASPEVLRVTRYADDGNEGSLRYAIEASNRAPGRYRIEIEAVGSAPYVIKSNAPLPLVKGPASIEGVAWKKTGEFIILDRHGLHRGQGAADLSGRGAGAVRRQRTHHFLSGSRADRHQRRRHFRA